MLPDVTIYLTDHSILHSVAATRIYAEDLTITGLQTW